jgi:molybdopterin-guanine dinucleotide biosynthesis protein
VLEAELISSRRNPLVQRLRELHSAKGRRSLNLLLLEGTHLAQESLRLGLAPVDLVLVEGYKASPHPKLEVHRPSLGKPPIWPGRPDIIAVASDTPLQGCDRLCLPLSDPPAIAAWMTLASMMLNLDEAMTME